MPRSSFDRPPRTGNEEFDNFIEELFHHTYGLGGDITGVLDDANVAFFNNDATITAEWTFSTHPLGLDHLQIANIGTNTHEDIDDHIDDTSSNPHGVTKTQVGLSNVENLKVKLDATSAPAVSNDNTEGYAVGSRWIDINNDKEYVCLDVTTGSAVWVETTGGGGGASPLTTKGDLFTYSTVDARLPVGTNGQALVADSTQTTGIKWTSSVEAFDGGAFSDTFTDTVDFDAGAF